VTAVYLTSGTNAHLCLERFRRSASFANCKHELVENPTDADIIIFAENYQADTLQRQVRRHPVYRRFRNKCFVFHENDNPIPIVPGIYSCIPQQFYRKEHVRTGPYVWMLRDPTRSFSALDGSEQFLSSFVGTSSSAAVRSEIMRLEFRRSYIQDTASTTHKMRHESTKDEQLNFFRHFDNILNDSKFVLCPRGEACSSIRFFETMRAGRVPVLIADDYVYPDFVRFDDFVVRVDERSVATVPDLLESLENEAIGRGKKARAAFETLWEGGSLLNYAIECCTAISKEPRFLSGWRTQLGFAKQVTSPPYFRNYQRRIRHLLLGAT